MRTNRPEPDGDIGSAEALAREQWRTAFRRMASIQALAIAEGLIDGGGHLVIGSECVLCRTGWGTLSGRDRLNLLLYGACPNNRPQEASLRPEKPLEPQERPMAPCGFREWHEAHWYKVGPHDEWCPGV